MKKLLVYLIIGVLFCTGCQCGNQQQKVSEPENAVKKESIQVSDGFLNASKLGRIISPDGLAQYSIVVGAYRQKEYADKKAETLKEQGYAPTIVQFKDGLLAVVLFPSDDKDATVKKIEELKSAEVCPVDGWILVND